MHLTLVVLLIVLSCCMPANSQGEDYSACFQKNIEVPGVEQTTVFSFAPKRELDGHCTNDKDCSDGFKCTPTTADPPVEKSNLATLPSFCQAPKATASLAVSGLGIFIPSQCRCIIDVVYVLDKSGSMGTTRFAYQIQFLKNLTNQLAALQQNKYCVKFAIVSFHHAGFYHLGLTYSVPAVISTLNTILSAGTGGGSNVHVGMTIGNNYFGTSGDRSYAPNVMLVTTDLIYGSVPFVNSIQAASLAIRNTGTCIHAVGINTNPSPSLVVLQAITGNLALVKYSLQHQLYLITNLIRQRLCNHCNPCLCPRGWRPYRGRCYRVAGPACWFYGNAICHKLGGKFTSNWAAAYAIGGSTAWFKHPNSPFQVNLMPFCTTTTQSVACCDDRRIVCERPCIHHFATVAELAELAKINPKGIEGEGSLPPPPPPVVSNPNFDAIIGNIKNIKNLGKKKED